MANFLALITDPVTKDLHNLKLFLPHVDLVSLPEIGDPLQQKDLIQHADALFVNLAPVDAALVASLKRCKIIARFGAGVDNVDVATASCAGIYVCNVVDYCTDEVSDHVMALLLAMSRKIVDANALVQAGQWSVEPLMPMRRLRGRTLGLVGGGRIGRAVAAKASAFGMTVMIFDPYVSESNAIRDAEYVSFDELLSRSHVISLHAPAGPDTVGLFGDDTFQKIRPGTVLINTSRGAIIRENSLLMALDKRIIVGAGLDVVEKEPLHPSSQLRNRADVLLTPHVAYYSEESLQELQQKAAEEVGRVLAGETPLHAVNFSEIQALRLR
jgi:D-3-phosphoglycerate dehydrogenase / 2-oxoglutarate reductase